MLQAAEEPSVKTAEEGGSSQTTEGTEENPPPKRKAKTKIGNKSKRKRKVKSTGKFPDGEEQYEVSFQVNSKCYNNVLVTGIYASFMYNFCNKELC